jgi:hypothetical protein
MFLFYTLMCSNYQEYKWKPCWSQIGTFLKSVPELFSKMVTLRVEDGVKRKTLQLQSCREFQGSPWSLLCVSLRASTPEGASGGPAQLGWVFFFFLLFPFFVNLEILGELKLKNAQIQKNYFEKLFRLKLIQFKIYSFSNFMFKFEKYVQTRICSNSNLFKFEFVHIRICSNLILFRFEFVQTRFCSDSIMFKFDFVRK